MNKEANFNDYVSAFRRRFSLMAWLFAGVLMGSLLLAYGTPPLYSSTGIIHIEQQEIPDDIVQTTITTFRAQHIETMIQRVLRYSNLMLILSEHEPYPLEDYPSLITDENRLQKFSDNIFISPEINELVSPLTGRTITLASSFSVSVLHKVPEIAQALAADLCQSFLAEDLASREAATGANVAFLNREVEQLAEEIDRTEAALAIFKERNADRLPELSDFIRGILARTEDDLADVQRDTQTVRERQIYLRSELAQITPYLSVSPDQLATDPAERLRQMQAEYLQLSAIYAVDHPDLANLRRGIAVIEQQLGVSGFLIDPTEELEARRAELAEALERYSDTHPDVIRARQAIAALEQTLANATARPRRKPNNPAYIQISAQLAAADGELRALTAKRRELERTRADYETRLAAMPQAELEFNTLNRDYHFALEQYERAKTDSRQAELARTMELDQKGERFVITSGPRVSDSPSKPNRILVLFLGFVLAVSLAGGSGIIAEATDQTLRGARDVERLLDTPPIAVIPYIMNTRDKRIRLGRLAGAALAAVIGIIVTTTVVTLYT